MDELILMVKEMKMKEKKEKTEIFKKIRSQETLTQVCVYGRYFLSPQSTDMESICLYKLKIEKQLNETSGDGHKNGFNYEIKISIHSQQSKINFVQIRPDHNIDYYILIAYNMYENNNIGKGFVFKIPSEDLYKLIINYGGYAHGTVSKLGKITIDNIKGRNCEYALRVCPNVKKGKNFELWNKLLEYKVDFHPNNF